MNSTTRFAKIALREAWRGKWVFGLAGGLMLSGELMLRFSGGGATTIVSLLDVALILTPLAGLVVGTLHVHNSRELIELLLAQPVRRRKLFVAMYAGAALPLAVSVMAGLLAPFAWHGMLTGESGLRMAGLAGAAGALACISSALAFVIALRCDDRVRALGVAVAAWLVAAVVWDGLLLLVAMVLGDGPVEIPLLVMLAINPLDVTRVLLLLGTDAAALLGYTGATLQDVLGTAVGRAALLGMLTTWMILPLLAAARTFDRKDF